MSLSGVSACETYVDGLMASTFFALNGLVGCGHMSGLMARRICPLALMKSDDRNPYQICELQAHVSQQVVFGLRWRPCRSSRLNALAKLQIVICATTLWICLQEGPSLRLCEYFGAEDFAGPHYRPDDPGELVGQRHRDEACRLFRQKRADPVGERAFALAHATQQ